MKKCYCLLTMILVTMMNVSLSSCGSDDSDELLIPAGTYVEENGHASELFTLEVSGNTIKWTCTIYGEVSQTIVYTYKISGNEITVYYNGESQTLFYKQNGNKITIGEITYIRQ